ncbi:hypothetical protein VQ643_12400 [Pseudomonas sp. F1_0610]|uniref:hypothetical protein n=1 Tax=Pseudomonas sp. F1_0610 TaxID=3114284 RepID=UPI0039C01F43
MIKIFAVVCKKLLLSLLLLLQVACVGIQKNDTVVFVAKPTWISGIKVGDNYSKDFPDAVQGEHIEVVNAGFWLMSTQQETKLAYEFALKVIQPFNRKVYSRAILADPSDVDHPFVYDHSLDMNTPATLVRHNHIEGLQDGQQYTLYFEFYADPERTHLIERIEQPIRSALIQENNCVYFGKVLSQERFNQEKMALFCAK